MKLSRKPSVARGVRNDDLVVAVTHLVDRARQLAEQLAQGAQHLAAEQNDRDQHGEEDAEINERRTLRVAEHLLALGGERIDGRHQDLCRHGGEIAAELRPAVALGVRGRRPRVGEGELAKLRQIAPVGGIERLVQVIDLRLGVVAQQLAEGRVEGDAAREERIRIRRQLALFQRQLADAALDHGVLDELDGGIQREDPPRQYRIAHHRCRGAEHIDGLRGHRRDHRGCRARRFDLVCVDLLAQRQHRLHPVVEQLELLVEFRVLNRQGSRSLADRPIEVVGRAARRVELGTVAAAGDELARRSAFSRDRDAAEARGRNREAQHRGGAAEIAVARPAVVGQPAAEDRQPEHRHQHDQHQQT
jgi:hypothetical protein